MAIRSVQETFGFIPSVGVKQWRWVRLSDISPLLQRAVIVAEDARFLQHRGVDFSSLFSVIQGEQRRTRTPRGASTLTMQTVKNLFLWPGRSYVRKCIELVISPLFDLIVGKKRTLEVYLNIVEWGPGIYGAEAAAQKFFRKSAKNLSLEESAALAAVLPSPLTVSPRALSPTARRRLSRIVREASTAVLP
jgi:monofunctional biosynthetic peptidoglycan transglycosylase